MERKCFEIAKSNRIKGREYYINIETGVSSWGFPLTKEVEDLSGWEVFFSTKVSEGNMYYSNVSRGITQWEYPKIEDAEEDLPLENGWKKKLSSKCNNVYYVNDKLNISQWKHPIPKLTLKPAPKPAPKPKPKPKSTPITAPLFISDYVQKPKVKPRGLQWIGNSCYLDSALFAFFAGPKYFIDKMLNMDLRGRVTEVEECTSKNLKKIQDELRKIYNSITRQGDPVINCTNLRKTLEKCPHNEKFHTSAQGDSGEFISYLTGLFPIDKNIMTVKSYYTNSLGGTLPQITNNPDTLKTETFDNNIGLMQVITSEQIQAIDIDNPYQILSDFLGETFSNVPEAGFFDGKTKYARKIEIRDISFSPYLIFSLMRIKEPGGIDIHENIIIPDDTIIIEGQKFSLTGAVMYNGRSHYVAIAKYNGSWWYYNDLEYEDSNSLGEFESFEHFLSEVKVDEKLVNPLTHGTQFYYTPVDVE